MRKRILIFHTIVYIFCFLFVSTIDANSQSKNANKRPKITFEQTYFDYGTIIEGESGVAVFNIKNEGNLPLIINNITASCGCIVSAWSKEQVLPGQKSQIKVIYNTNIIGEIKRSVTVTTNDPNQTRIVLILTGKVIEKIIN